MNISTIQGVRIQAIAACVPSNKVNNREFAAAHFSEDLSNTISALGVEERHVCTSPDTTALSLSISAAKKVLQGIDPEEIGAVVMVTLTPDYLMPNNASYAQYLLGLPSGIAAFDINHACSGFVYGLWNAALLCQNLQKKVLLLDGDVNSKYVSPTDKSTALLFGDAGTATLLTPDKDAKEWHFTFDTDGSNRDAILMRLGFKYPVKPEYLDCQVFEDGGKRRFIDMQMDGRKVFDYVVETVPKLVSAFYDEQETAAEEFSLLLLHQANQNMLKRLARKIGFDFRTQMPVCMDKYGNTSSVSIPLTMASELKTPAGHVLMIGMGAGLATGIADLYLDGMVNYGVLEESV